MIGFWKNKDGNFRSDRRGLTQKQIDLLHSLREGDRLAIYVQLENEGTDRPTLDMNKIKVI